MVLGATSDVTGGDRANNKRNREPW